MSQFDITGEFTIKAQIDMDDVEKRAMEPDFPYRNHDGSPLNTEQLIQHFAHNAVANGVTDLSDLDGFADWERGRATMRVSSVGVSDV